MDPQQYDYIQSGFDNFLSRGLDDVSMINLDSSGPQTTQVAYDRTQTTGILGDSLRIGRWVLDGVSGQLILYDERNENRIAVLGDIEDIR